MMATESLENHPYDELRVGQSAELQRTLTRDDIALFGKVSGDLNPTHLDAAFAASSAAGLARSTISRSSTCTPLATSALRARIA